MKSSAVEVGMDAGDDGALFQALVRQIGELASGITVDAGKWGQYATFANSANGEVSLYAQHCQRLCIGGEDQASWSAVKNAAAAALGQAERAALIAIFNGFLAIGEPSHNSGPWATLRQLAYASLDALDPATFKVLMRRVRQLSEDSGDDAGQWRRYAAICADAQARGVRAYIDRCATELGAAGPDRDSWARVIRAANSGAPRSHPDDALRMIMLGFLGITRPARNGAQWAALRRLALAQLDCGASIAFEGADTRELLEPAQLPAAMSARGAEQLNLHPGDITLANIEQGPDGRFYLIAGNAHQSVLWTSATLVPDLAQWQQVPLSSTGQLGGGRSMLAWISRDKVTKHLCYVQPGEHGMQVRQLMYMVVEGQVVGVDIADANGNAWYS